MDKPDLSTLLKLKKHEQPDPEFWENFDAKLHQKTLKTLVEKTSLRSRAYLKLKAILHPGLAMPAAAAAALLLYVSAPVNVITQDQLTPASEVIAVASDDLSEVATKAEAHFKANEISAPISDTIYGTKEYNNNFKTVAAQQELVAGTEVPKVAEELTTAQEVYYLASNMTAGKQIGLPSSSYFGL